MLKTTYRYMIVAVLAAALGLLIYHVAQPTSAASAINNVGRLSTDLGGEGGFHEGGFSLLPGVSGITTNLLLVGVVTAIVVSIRRVFARQPGPRRTH